MRRMALLRNLEQSLSGLLEGTVGRVFRNEVRPTEIARKLAREMEINKRVSLSRTYAPTDYLVYLSPEDRARYAGVEHSIAEELGAYLLEHARRERLVLVRRPLVEFRTDQRLHLGEFGIEARTAPISAQEAPPRADPVADAPGREMAPPAGAAPRPSPEERAATLSPDPDPEPDFRPATPIGAVPDPIDEDDDPGYHDEAEEPAYADPYAGDPFDDDVSQPDDDRWHEEPAPHVDVHEEPVAPAPAPVHEPEAESEPGDDWLDPVDPWDPEPPGAAPAPPPAPEPVAEAPAAPPARIEPRAPEPPASISPTPGADPSLPPWIDPTLARQQQRAPIAPPVSPPPLRPRTTIVVDGTPHELHGDVVVLGRSRSADIVVSDPSVSRRHLELRRDDRGWYALDLGSTNGSQINGASVAEPRRLEPGMRIKLGHAPALIEVR